MTKQHSRESIYRRKNHHIYVALRGDVEFVSLTSGFEEYQLGHCALPEINLSDVTTATVFLGKTVSAPLLISPITGGTPDAFRILTNIAEAARDKGITLGVGSQRIALENPDLEQFFKIRDVAGSVPVLANLGAVQLNYGMTIDHCRRAVEMLEADALVLHLNPLQECLQAGGDTDFSGLLAKIEGVSRLLPVPVIVKEVGFGISVEVARQLAGVGVAAIDLAGAGGTSWARVEAEVPANTAQKSVAQPFVSWGVPTARLLAEYGKSFEIPLIASGGIRSGVDVAKAVAMGASLAGMALPFLKAANRSAEAVSELIEQLTRELRIAMFCTGCADIKQLRSVELVHLKQQAGV